VPLEKIAAIGGYTGIERVMFDGLFVEEIEYEIADGHGSLVIHIFRNGKIADFKKAGCPNRACIVCSMPTKTRPSCRLSSDMNGSWGQLIGDDHIFRNRLKFVQAELTRRMKL